MVVDLKHKEHIAQYRAEAAVCMEWANNERNKATAARWLKTADEWNRMADELEQKIK
jgi:hypothetical protein